MYSAPYFKAKDQQEVVDFMQHHPFVMLIGKGETFPVATQVPVELKMDEEGRIKLVGHIMRKTDHAKALEKDPNVLVVFTAEHAYISASWYTQPKAVSTWNYRAVHAQGTINFLDEAATLQIVTDVTAKYEAHSKNPSLVKDMDEDYVRKNLKAIVGFEILVSDIQHVFKMSQNRDAASYHHIITQLKEGDAEAKAVAEAM